MGHNTFGEREKEKVMAETFSATLENASAQGMTTRKSAKGTLL